MTKPMSWRRQLATTNFICRAAAAHLRAAVTQTSPEFAAKKLFGKLHGLDPFLTRATSTPATLTNPAWAGVVAHDVIASELIQRITALSAAASLMGRGMKVDLTGVGSMTIPGRLYSPSAGGGWIAEGGAIPMRQPNIAPGPRLQPRKLGVLATFTAEMVMADSIEEFTTAAIREAAAALLDLQLFSTTAGDATRPAGILVGATTVTPTTATEPWAISSDIGALVQALAVKGGGLEPVLVAAPAQAAALRMWRQQDFYDIYASVALAAGTVVAVESSSFVSGLDGIPEFSTSIGTTLHFENAAPTDITGGTPSPAVPVKSLFQTDVVGLRMILRASWGMRNPAHVAIVENVTW
jgi:hypothetical protein